MQNNINNNLKMTTLVFFLFVILFGTFASAEGIAQCVSKFQNIFIEAKPAYGIGENIGGINITLINSSIGNNLQFKAFLLNDNENGTAVLGSVTPTGSFSNGIAPPINFKYAATAPGKYVIKVDVSRDFGRYGIERTEYRQIVIAKNFRLKLNCPIINYINTDVKCEWNPTDISIGTAVLIDIPKVTVTQGDIQLASPVSGSSLTFKTDTSGNVKVLVEAKAKGYVNSNEEINVQVQDAVIKQSFEIDNKDYALYSATGIDTGTRQLIFKITEGGGLAQVKTMSANIITPAGQEIPLTFIQSQQFWKSSFNFQDAGRKYVMKGNIYLIDPSKAPIPFSYDILTLAAQSEKERSSITGLVIYGSIFLIVVLGAGAFFYFKRRR